MPSLEQGSIVWASMLDPAGRNRKTRPAVVVSSTNDIEPGRRIWVVGVTSRCDPMPENSIELPWHPQKHRRTGLKVRSLAVCDWLTSILFEDIEDIGGVVPPQRMIDILNALRA